MIFGAKREEKRQSQEEEIRGRLLSRSRTCPDLPPSDVESFASAALCVIAGSCLANLLLQARPFHSRPFYHKRGSKRDCE